jgi:hypothetical protein
LRIGDEVSLLTGATFELGGFTPSVSYAARFGQDMATLYRAAITDSPGEAG